MISNLRGYIDDTQQREKECQPFLDQIAPLLCLETPKQILAYGREDPARGGYADYTVSAIISDGGRAERRVAYVWEVKAPQLYCFEHDESAQRLRPTKDLVRAESQLFHYAAEFAESTAFKSKYKLDAAGQVRPAGFIIGRSSSLIKPNAKYPVTADDEMNLYDLAVARRDMYLYRAASLRLKNWDWVYEQIASAQSSTIPMSMSTGLVSSGGYISP